MTAQLPSKVRLAQIASFSKSMALPPSHDEIEAMARFALAAHEQEPYGYVHKAIYESTGSSGLTNDHAAYRGTDGSHVPVFLHPAPVPAVPDERTWLFYCEKYPEMPMGDAIIRAVEWNACRVAMLNHLEQHLDMVDHSGDVNEKVAPPLQPGNSGQPAGYVLVPVEPTPEMCDVGHIGIDVLTGVTSDSEYYSTWGDSAAKLYRAMLSAAPKVTGNQLTPALGWTDNSDANAALVMLDRIDTLDLADDDRIEEVKQIIRSLAAPTAPDGWIPVSERMPPCKTGVLVATEMDGPGDWRMKWATYVPEHPDAINGWLIPGATWTPTHWQPLPDAPKV